MQKNTKVFFLVCVILAQILAHGLQLSFGAIEPFVSWRYKVSVTDTGRKTEFFKYFFLNKSLRINAASYFKYQGRP